MQSSALLRGARFAPSGARSLPFALFPLNAECDMAEQLLLFANELRTRAKEILVRAAITDDLEIRDMRRVIAADYQKLARQVEQRVREGF
jgi:hypothetical protein